jgi:hypothetical protein
MEQAVFPFFLALPLNPITFKLSLHLFWVFNGKKYLFHNNQLFCTMQALQSLQGKSGTGFYPKNGSYFGGSLNLNTYPFNQ